MLNDVPLSRICKILVSSSEVQLAELLVAEVRAMQIPRSSNVLIFPDIVDLNVAQLAHPWGRASISSGLGSPAVVPSGGIEEWSSDDAKATANSIAAARARSKKNGVKKI
ncbi:hypothetical protein CT676_42690 [Bradyrhizobium sp. MOS001]|uniref:hypothetical protein n=1 Tax=Bradyrhizobium sp. MOS001 TaxID=2133948 RepID=UPI0010753418|nr:hypothetical protein [Bradyrhizobium sp. MOS001]TFW52275.1 hypothetical protein CT676_42690 [Bradyrhizobium sp. MOS001]